MRALIINLLTSSGLVKPSVKTFQRLQQKHLQSQNAIPKFKGNTQQLALQFKSHFHLLFQFSRNVQTVLAAVVMAGDLNTLSYYSSLHTLLTTFFHYATSICQVQYQMWWLLLWQVQS